MSRLLCLIAFLPMTVLAEGYMIPYDTAQTVTFKLWNTDSTLDVDEVDGGAEVTIYCEAADGTTSNATATDDFNDEGSHYNLDLTAAETQCAVVVLSVAATDLNVIEFPTYGHPDSLNPGLGSLVEATGTPQANASTTTLILAAAESFGDDVLIGHMACVDETTRECQIVTDNVGSTDTLTVCSAYQSAPTTTHRYTIFKGDWGCFPFTAGVPDVNTTTLEGTDATDAINTEVDNSHETYGLDDLAAALVFGAALQTADSGSANTLVDAALTQATNDWFTDTTAVVFISGTLAGQSACVDDFDAATDTITFSPATTAAVSTHTYYLIPAPGCQRFR